MQSGVWCKDVTTCIYTSIIQCHNFILSLTDFYFLRRDVETTAERVKEIRDSACLQQLEQEVADLELKAADSSFWDDRAKAQENLSDLTDVKERIRLLNEFKSQVSAQISLNFV